ncbi:MAG: response regulator [Bacteroidetes bacterium]|nr:MAG: response regulator [Bacteroidota bacterium]
MSKLSSLWIVDDDKIYQFILKKNIEQLHITDTISSFPHGKEAIDTLRQLIENQSPLPDLILLDINMPVMDGWDFMEEYIVLKKQFEKTIPIYIISSSIAQEDKTKARSYEDIVDFLVKPVDLSFLSLS